jgi:hypothetical protein
LRPFSDALIEGVHCFEVAMRGPEDVAFWLAFIDARRAESGRLLRELGEMTGRDPDEAEAEAIFGAALVDVVRIAGGTERFNKTFEAMGVAWRQRFPSWKPKPTNLTAAEVPAMRPGYKPPKRPQPGADDASTRPPTSASAKKPRAAADAQHDRCLALLDQILRKKHETIDSWLKSHEDLSRTSLKNYRAGRIKGKISREKRAAIETAILESARELGL